MRLLFRSLAILLIGMSASVSGAQDDLESLRRRLAEVEAQQAKSQETIEELRSLIGALGRDTEKDGGLVARLAKKAPSVASAPGPAPRYMFPELADESQFVLTSEDEAFTFGIDGLIVARGEYSHLDDDGTGSSRSDQGFEMTGSRINFRGSVYRKFGYWARLQADEFGADPIFDAFMGIWYVNENTTLVFGQFPSLLTRENGTPVDKITVIEASPTNFTFSPFGFKGVMLGYHTPRLHLRGIINDGYRSSSNSYFEEPSANWAFAGQALGMAVGDDDDWKRFNNFTSRPGSDFAWLLNGAFFVQEGASNLDPDGKESDDLFLGIVESSMEGDGWNLYASGYYRRTDSSTEGFKVNDFGFVLQGGLWVSEHFEVYSRFDMTIPDDDRLLERDDFRTLTGGVNYYPLPHTDNIKLSTDLIYMFDAEADSIVQPNVFSSVRASSDDQWVFRTHAQIRW